MHPVHCPAPATSAAVRAGHLLRCVAPLCAFRRENSCFGCWGTSQYPGTTCNNFIADLLFLSEVLHSFLVAGGPCVHPYLGKWALGAGAGACACVPCVARGACTATGTATTRTTQDDAGAPLRARKQPTKRRKSTQSRVVRVCVWHGRVARGTLRAWRVARGGCGTKLPPNCHWRINRACCSRGALPSRF
jgi:hypothetical protein